MRWIREKREEKREKKKREEKKREKREKKRKKEEKKTRKYGLMNAINIKHNRPAQTVSFVNETSMVKLRGKLLL